MGVGTNQFDMVAAEPMGGIRIGPPSISAQLANRMFQHKDLVLGRVRTNLIWWWLNQWEGSV